MSIVRAPNPNRDFTIIGNAATRDPRLRMSDLGLLVRLLSMPPWKSTNIAELARGATDGESAVRAALKRLTAVGYVRRQRIRKSDGTWDTLTFVYDSPEPGENPVEEQEQRRTLAEASGMEQIPGLDVPAGQNQRGKSTLDVTSGNGASSQVRTSVEKPHVDYPPWIDHGGSPSNYVSTSPRTPSMEASTEPSPVDVLAMEIMDGLREINLELAGKVHRAGVASACRSLVDCGWTPLQIRAWTVHQNWSGAGPGAVVERLKSLGLPPERPRSVEPAPQYLCPAHPGQRTRAGTCDLCVQERTAGPPAEFVAARRGGAA